MLVFEFQFIHVFCASRQKILAPAGASGVWAYGPHTRAARDQTAGVQQYGPPAQFSTPNTINHVENISNGEF